MILTLWRSCCVLLSCDRVLRLYDFTLLFDVVTITGLPAFITRAVWVQSFIRAEAVAVYLIRSGE